MTFFCLNKLPILVALDTILKIEHLNKKFGALHAVNDLSLTITKGNVYGLLGPNGSGKSTTLGMILNVVNKSSGSYEWFGGKYQKHQALKKVGAIIEHPNFYPYMTAYQNLKLVCKIKGAPITKIEEKLAMVNLLDRKNDKFKSYSLGMKQRLAIASALLNDPEFLILDEPTNGLDPQGIHEVRQIIRDIANDGTTILLASHLLDEVEKVCDHVIVIRKGKKLFEGPVAEIIGAQTVIELKTNGQNGNLVQKIQESFSQLSNVRIEDNMVYANTSDDFDLARFNKALCEVGIYLTHFVQKKPKLEEQFLSLTNEKKSNV